MFDSQILAGVSFLDSKAGEGWVWLVDLNRLEMDDASKCICGQVETARNGGKFPYLTPRLLNDDQDRWAGSNPDLGFVPNQKCHLPSSWTTLRDEWRKMIVSLRSQRPR